MALSIFVLVVVGIVFRIAAGYIVSNGFKQNERIVIIMSMLPKATLQVNCLFILIYTYSVLGSSSPCGTHDGECIPSSPRGSRIREFKH